MANLFGIIFRLIFLFLFPSNRKNRKFICRFRMIIYQYVKIISAYNFTECAFDGWLYPVRGLYLKEWGIYQRKETRSFV